MKVTLHVYRYAHDVEVDFHAPPERIAQELDGPGFYLFLPANAMSLSAGVLVEILEEDKVTKVDVGVFPSDPVEGINWPE